MYNYIMNNIISPYLLLHLDNIKDILKEMIFQDEYDFKSSVFMKGNYDYIKSKTDLQDVLKLDKLDEETKEYIRDYCYCFGFEDEYNLISILEKLKDNYEIICDDFLYNKINKWFPNISRDGTSEKTIEILKYPYNSKADIIIKYEDVVNETTLNDNILCTTLYSEKNEKRINEYLLCLTKNINNKDIGRIIIFYEIVGNIDDDKLLTQVKLMLRPCDQIVYIEKRPSYIQIYEYCNNSFLNKIIILTNSDIYFSTSQGLNILKNYNYDGQKPNCVVLTRYNDLQYMPNYKCNNSIYLEHEGLKLRSENFTGYSQDTWIIKTPIKINSLMNLDMGVVGCDNFMIHALSKNYKVINPSKSIISVHVHEGWNSGKYSTVYYNGKKMNRGEYLNIKKKEGHVIQYLHATTI